MTYEEAINKIHSYLVFGSKLGLHRMKSLLGVLGNPQDSLKIVHIAGTNGKGSVSRYIYTMLQECGYKAGIYISPYIDRFTERIEFDGRQISPEDLAKYTKIVTEAADAMVARGEESPTEFEIITAIGFLYFKEMEADVVVLEVGLGGDGDSTNVCSKPEVTVITSISYDHMEQLGNTLEEIAACKAGILKDGVPAVVCVDDPGAEAVIRGVAEKHHAPYIRVRDFEARDVMKSVEGYSFEAELDLSALDPEYGNMKTGRVQLSMQGMHQVDNALCALGAVTAMKLRGWDRISPEKMLSGITRAVQPARLEVMNRDPYVIVDGSHNPAGAKCLADTVLDNFRGKRILLINGILRDKSYEEMVDEYLRFEPDVMTAEVPNPRTMDPKDLAEVFRSRELYSSGRRSVGVLESPEQMKEFVSGALGRYDLIVFAGSLYLMGDVRRMLKDLSEKN